MDQSEKTIRVLRHGSEVEIPAHEFNAATDTRLDGKPAGDLAAEGGTHSSGSGTSASSGSADRSDRGKK